MVLYLAGQGMETRLLKGEAAHFQKKKVAMRLFLGPQACGGRTDVNAPSVLQQLRSNSINPAAREEIRYY